MNAFTLKFEHASSMLNTFVSISSFTKRPDNKCAILENCVGLWDTGARCSSISFRIVEKLDLLPVDTCVLSTANGYVKANMYQIDLHLPNNVIIQDMKVTCSDIGNDTDILIGLDVIYRGDFSITNVNGYTTFTFRVPSICEIDYVNQ